jgi:hypothetical protein|tara:strand:+ start:85 stop:399 length:315 start_codon:yes stop_codon:yes gene_type:complete
MATNKEKFNKKYGFNKNEPHSISEISKLSGIKRSILQEVYNRGVGAWKSNPASVRLKSGQKAPNAPRSAKMGKEQWGVARVYSFVMGGKTRSTADKDLWEKHKK